MKEFKQKILLLSLGMCLIFVSIFTVFAEEPINQNCYDGHASGVRGRTIEYTCVMGEDSWKFDCCVIDATVQDYCHLMKQCKDDPENPPPN